ncbi:MAG: integral rane protein-like protein [Frankiales bacterium]|nr:integral rane protein-like protein [Frankiales bacterium]
MATTEQLVPTEPPDADIAVEVTRDDWLRALRFSALVYLGVRLGLFLVGLVSTALLPRNAVSDVPGWPATQPSQSWHHVFTSFERFDALWFLRIASTGYRQDDASAAFFPLYPLLSRGVANLTGNRWLLGAYLVSNIALIVGLTVFYRLTALEFSDRTARRAVLYLAVFPTSFFLFAPYTESLFLALSVGCLYAARRSSWLLAGYLGALASLTRSTGLLLALPLAVEALLQYRSSSRTSAQRMRGLAAGLLAAAGVGLGIGAYFLYWESVAGDWRRPLDVQGSNWSREKSWPWETLGAGLREGTRYFGSYAGGYHSVDLVLVLVALAAGVWIALRVRLTYSLYYWAALLFPMTLAFGGRPLLSMPRFLLVMFPLFWGLARLSERWKAHDAVVAASATGLGLLTVLFVNWYFIF